MRIVIAGGHGQIARQFSRLVTETGHQPVGMIRSPEHITDLEEDGAEPAMINLETTDVDEMTKIVRGADAVRVRRRWWTGRQRRSARRPSTRAPRSCSPTRPRPRAYVAT